MYKYPIKAYLNFGNPSKAQQRNGRLSCASYASSSGTRHNWQGFVYV